MKPTTRIGGNSNSGPWHFNRSKCLHRRCLGLPSINFPSSSTIQPCSRFLFMMPMAPWRAACGISIFGESRSCLTKQRDCEPVDWDFVKAEMDHTVTCGWPCKSFYRPDEPTDARILVARKEPHFTFAALAYSPADRAVTTGVAKQIRTPVFMISRSSSMAVAGLNPTGNRHGRGQLWLPLFRAVGSNSRMALRSTLRG